MPDLDPVVHAKSGGERSREDKPTIRRPLAEGSVLRINGSDLSERPPIKDVKGPP